MSIFGISNRDILEAVIDSNKQLSEKIATVSTDVLDAVKRTHRSLELEIFGVRWKIVALQDSNSRIESQLSEIKGLLDFIVSPAVPEPVTFSSRKVNDMIETTVTVKAANPKDKIAKQELTINVPAGGEPRVFNDIAANEDVQITFNSPDEMEDVQGNYELIDIDANGTRSKPRSGLFVLDTTAEMVPGEVQFASKRVDDPVDPPVEVPPVEVPPAESPTVPPTDVSVADTNATPVVPPTEPSVLPPATDSVTPPVEPTPNAPTS